METITLSCGERFARLVLTDLGIHCVPVKALHSDLSMERKYNKCIPFNAKRLKNHFHTTQIGACDKQNADDEKNKSRHAEITFPWPQSLLPAHAL